MARTRRKGALRYLLLAIIPQSLSRGFEAMGDRAVAEAGIGNGAGAPYYIAALLLTVIAGALFLFGLKRLFDRLRGKDRSDADPSGEDRPEPRPGAFAAPQDFDPDAALQRYMAKRAADETPRPATRIEPAAAPRPGGFGRKGL
ncbi:MAG: hypothetical protein J0L50_07600 [Sphingomonadales bacterium]|nr:hypothetical protein [Sphingomonadales bacterium]